MLRLREALITTRRAEHEPEDPCAKKSAIVHHDNSRLLFHIPHCISRFHTTAFPSQLLGSFHNCINRHHSFGRTAVVRSLHWGQRIVSIPPARSRGNRSTRLLRLGQGAQYITILRFVFGGSLLLEYSIVGKNRHTSNS